MKQGSDAKIAWVLCNLLDEVNELLWNRYDREFIRFAAEEEEEEIKTGERLSEMNPDSPSEPDF
jgi:hypothetical protein